MPCMARSRPPARLDQILQAATRVFARTGLEASKMSDVAEARRVIVETLVAGIVAPAKSR